MVMAEGHGSDKGGMALHEGGKVLLGAGLHVLRQQLVVIDLCHLQMYTSPKAKTETFIFDKPKKSLHQPPQKETRKWQNLPQTAALARTPLPRKLVWRCARAPLSGPHRSGPATALRLEEADRLQRPRQRRRPRAVRRDGERAPVRARRRRRAAARHAHRLQHHGLRRGRTDSWHLHITAATLTGPRGPVELRTVDRTTPTVGPFLPPGSGFLIPVAPLEPATTYTASVRFGRGQARRTWHFTTATAKG